MDRIDRGLLGNVEFPQWIEPLLSASLFGKFLSVGAIGAVCDNAVLVMVVELASVDPVWGAFVSKETSITLMFLLNNYWTFSEYRQASLRVQGRRFAKSNLVRAGGGAVGIAALYVFHDVLGVWYLLANILGIGVGFFVNYTLENLVTWKTHAA